MTDDDKDRAAELNRLANLPEPGLIADFWDFLETNKKWWLTPIVIAMALLFFLLAVGNSSAAPFIYSLF